MTGGFFSMGGYAAFIWPCYALTAIAMLWLAYASWRKAKDNAARLDALEQGPPVDRADAHNAER
jgi:heme exporter protein D